MFCDFTLIFVFVLQPYSQLATPLKQANAMGYIFDNKILDIDNLDVSTVHC